MVQAFWRQCIPDNAEVHRNRAEHLWVRCLLLRLNPTVVVLYLLALPLAHAVERDERTFTECAQQGVHRRG